MKKVITLSLLAVLVSSITATGQATPRRTDKDFSTAFDAYVLAALKKSPDIPGLAIAVINGDKAIFVRGYGMSDREAGVKADGDTLYYIASSTKSFTALAAALLDRDGKIKLDDPVVKYAAGIPIKNPLPEKVKIRDLLTHTSGLRNRALGFRMAYSGQSDPKDMAWVFGEATTFDEAAYGRYAYNNLGYNIYAVLLQNHLNKPWQDLLHETVFDPLGMKHTTAYISRARAKKWAVAAPYIIDPVTGKSVRSPLAKIDNNMQSAGGLFASAADLAKWLSMNMNNGKLNGKQVIPADVINAVHKGQTATVREAPPFSGAGEYGLGWQIGKYKDQKVIYHHGGFPGYRAHVSFLPEKKVAVAVLVNDSAAGGTMADLLATYVYDWWLQSPDLEADYAKRLQELSDNYEQGKQRFMSGFAERAKRTWQLTKPVADYVGVYESDLLGTMEITKKGNGLVVKLGNMNCAATAYTETETIRVELIPGTGEVIKFVVGTDQKVESLTYGGLVFKKKA